MTRHYNGLREGWLRHQKDAAKPPSPAQTGWLVPKKLFRSLNEPPRRCELIVIRRYSPPCTTARRGGCVIKKIWRSHRSRRSRGGFPFGLIGNPPRPRDKRMRRDIF